MFTLASFVALHVVVSSLLDTSMLLSMVSALPADVSARFIATSMLSMLSIAESEHVLNLVSRIQIVRKLQKMIHEVCT